MYSSLYQVLKHSRFDKKTLKSLLKFVILSDFLNETKNQRLKIYWLLRFSTTVAISTKQIAINQVNSGLSTCISNFRGQTEIRSRANYIDKLSESCRLLSVLTFSTFVSRLPELNTTKILQYSQYCKLSIEKIRREQYLYQIKTTQRVCDAQLLLF